MATVFDNPLFKKVSIFRNVVIDSDVSENWEFVMVLRQTRGNYLAELIKQDSKGALRGRVISITKNGLNQPLEFPEWFVPGTIFKTVLDGLEVVLTVKPKFQSTVLGITEILGLSAEFDFVISSEFYD